MAALCKWLLSCVPGKERGEDTSRQKSLQVQSPGVTGRGLVEKLQKVLQGRNMGSEVGSDHRWRGVQ